MISTLFNNSKYTHILDLIISKLSALYLLYFGKRQKVYEASSIPTRCALSALFVITAIPALWFEYLRFIAISLMSGYLHWPSSKIPLAYSLNMAEMTHNGIC